MSYNPYLLDGKTILVTGASSGIGKATAIECSKLNSNLVVTGRNKAKLLETMGLLSQNSHICVDADLTQEKSLFDLVEKCPNLDGVVLCAGVGYTMPFTFCTRDKFDKIFNINFFAPVELLRLLIKKKKLSKGASIVFVSSVGGVSVFNLGNSIYGASKGAFNSMMKQCALELANKGIRVNSVNPGMVNTNLIHEGMSFSEEELKNDEKRYPLGRYGEPEDIAKSISFLLSDASSWITGSELVIDGGLHLL